MMLRKYALKMGIGLIKAKIVYENEAFEPGNSIRGHIELTGGIVPLKVKRYDIDLMEFNARQPRENIVNSHSVICSFVLNTNDKKEVPFSLELPEEMESRNYMVAARVVLENDHVLTEESLITMNPKGVMNR